MLNSSVHIAMYGYYFLAALGPYMQKYLWWKVYVTRLQIVSIQTHWFCVFVCCHWQCSNKRSYNYFLKNDFFFQAQLFIAAAYVVYLYKNDCTMPKSMAFIIIIDLLTFIYLFVNFYIDAYVLEVKKSYKTISK